MMQLNRACLGKPGHTMFLKNRTVQPVVLSANRFNAMLGRSYMAEKHEKKAADEEEHRYMEYLKEGSEKLCSCFTNVGQVSFDEEHQARLDQEVREDEIRKRQVKKEDEQHRKERIMRANRILENLKSGQRALHHALVESELSYQRNFNETLNREIAEDAARQQRLDEQQCPEQLIPFCGVTEEQEKAEQAKKSLDIREYFQKELAERHQQRLEQKEKEQCEVIIERAQYKCLQEEEEKAAKRLAESKREFCRRAYKEAVKEKAEAAKLEHIYGKIEDRVICVDKVMRRKLDSRNGRAIKTLRENQIRDREAIAIELCRVQQAKQREEEEHQREIVEHHDVEVNADADRRLCRVEELRKERIAYQKEERKQLADNRKRDAQIHRFHVAERFKNQLTNERFAFMQKRKRENETDNLRKLLHGQRDEFLARHNNELMRISACEDDPYLQDDVAFFDDAVKMVKHAKEGGRPVYPMAKVVEDYRRKNQIDMVPEGRMVRRNKLRDYCWPGYHSKADLAYRKYDQKEECRQKQENNRQGIFDKCIKITKMATEEKPYKKCAMECPIKCIQYRGLPAMDDVDSFDCGSNVCYVDAPLSKPCAAQTNY
ncbi:trichohyalin-like [Drosophila sulfurigaster albostrigata]|uniref:trichohyalin-like n=1 Tax=Drosophila sulfurigaster albostrigata TaxID=89887 RepID=UPI002D21B404|nr:trichohyalin-like [Drosophila sulfurigaster albostrigata]